MNRSTIECAGKTFRIVPLATMGAGRLPVVHRILIENLLRHGRGDQAMVSRWLEGNGYDAEIAFWPSRIMMHDTTCGPALVDIAAARSVLAERDVDPALLNPVIPVDVSTDHSIAVDHYGVPGAAAMNMAREMERNRERFVFMKWASAALRNFTVHPPGTGIMHTINLERLASVVVTENRDGEAWACPDTLIGTDSHTPMVNGIGVLGWGVGGLEAESVMLGTPVMLRVPEVLGVRLTGTLREGVGATDLALHVTHCLRQIELAGRFVEFFGPGVATLSAGERSVVANMAPEYGSSTGFFPVDSATLAYLRQTGRSEAQIDLVETYHKATGLWFDPNSEPSYTEVFEIELSDVAMSLAGPRRPQDQIAPGDLPAILGEGCVRDGEVPVRPVALAAITSCTNTSDPRSLIAAGLVARNACRHGLKVPDWVKTSLAPGSPTAEMILRRAGLMDDLEALGFAVTGFGCTVCIGNSGPLSDRLTPLVSERAVDPVGVLSGNRNFPGRVHPSIGDAFLASPALVVAFAIAGNAAIDIGTAVLAQNAWGEQVTLADLWPTGAEIDRIAARAMDASDYESSYAKAHASSAWEDLAAPSTATYPWDEASTYLRPPPFVRRATGSRLGRYRATPLLVVGDDVTTDHISPAGAIPFGSEAAAWLVDKGADPSDLNVFSSRRGNWEVMVRGMFTNPNVRNLLAPEITPGSTLHGPSRKMLPLWQAARLYAQTAEPLVLLAGQRYGTGSSRDWAAKGIALLGVRAVIAASFERIHRTNLVNMAVLPISVALPGFPAALSVGIEDRLEIDATPERIAPHAEIPITLIRASGARIDMIGRAEIETRMEADILRSGGLIPRILSQYLGSSD